MKPNQMEVIGKNRHRDLVNSKVCSLRFQLLFNPNLAMVEVLSRDGIESKKKAATCDPSDDVQDCNLGWIGEKSNGSNLFVWGGAGLTRGRPRDRIVDSRSNRLAIDSTQPLSPSGAPNRAEHSCVSL